MTVSKLLSTAFCSERAFREHVSPDSLFQQALPILVPFSLCCLPTLVQLRWHEEQKYFHLPTPPSNRHHSPQQPHYRHTAKYSHTHSHTHTHTHYSRSPGNKHQIHQHTQFYVTCTDTSVLWQQTDSIAPKPATTLITVPLHQSSSYLWPKYLSSTISSTRLFLQLFSFGNSCPLCSSVQQPADVLSALC